MLEFVRNRREPAYLPEDRLSIGIPTYVWTGLRDSTIKAGIALHNLAAKILPKFAKT
jgi:hypothetical protein